MGLVSDSCTYGTVKGLAKPLCVGTQVQYIDDGQCKAPHDRMRGDMYTQNPNDNKYYKCEPEGPGIWNANKECIFKDPHPVARSQCTQRDDGFYCTPGYLKAECTVEAKIDGQIAKYDSCMPLVHNQSLFWGNSPAICNNGRGTWVVEPDNIVLPTNKIICKPT